MVGIRPDRHMVPEETIMEATMEVTMEAEDRQGHRARRMEVVECREETGHQVIEDHRLEECQSCHIEELEHPVVEEVALRADHQQ